MRRKLISFLIQYFGQVLTLLTCLHILTRLLRQLASFQLLLQELSLSAKGRLHILVVGDGQWRLNRVVVARDGRHRV